MHYPKVFISKNFFQILDNELTQAKKEDSYENSEKQLSIQRMLHLINTSHIYSDLTTSEFLSISESYESLKTLVSYIFQKFKRDNRSFYPGKSILDCKSTDFTFFIDEENYCCEIKSKKFGNIYVGRNPTYNKFYLSHSFPNKNTDPVPGDQLMENLKHPCNSMIIIDRYLLIYNIRYKPKVPNLISFLKKFIELTKLSEQFEIDILVFPPPKPSKQGKNRNENFTQDNKIIREQYYKKIVDFIEQMKKLEISAHIYVVSSLSADRFILTNYATITIGHPFDRPSYISSNFYPSNNTVSENKQSYQYWKDKLQNAYYEINKCKINNQWKTDNKSHSIFNVLKE